MCVIAGRFSTKPISRYDLIRAVSAMSHRCHYASCIYFSSEGKLGLGHTRLAIIDLASTGNQPMHAGGYTITFNGETYNFRELRRELLQQGFSFAGHSDTEVLLKGYIAWG